MEIAKDVHLVAGMVAHAYLLVDAEGLTLIDAGLPFFTSKILGQIHSLGFQPGDLKQIIITHADMDHFGGLKRLRTQTQAQVMTSAVEAEAIRRGVSSRPLPRKGLSGAFMGLLVGMTKPRPTQVDRLLTDGEDLPILDGVKVILTPGHTPGHISLWCPRRKILFSGDSIVVREDHFEPYQDSTVWKPEIAIQSYRLQAGLNPEIVCGGHGWTDRDVAAKFDRGGTD